MGRIWWTSVMAIDVAAAKHMKNVGMSNWFGICHEVAGWYIFCDANDQNVWLIPKNLRWTNLRSARNSHVFPGLLVLPEGGRPVHIACSLWWPRSKRWGVSRSGIIWNHLDSVRRVSSSASARSWRVSLCQGQLAEDHVGGLVLSFPTHPAARSVDRT